MKPTVVFIASLGHSGSTLLDLMLGAHPRFVGLGEVNTLLSRGGDSPSFTGTCSCGRDASECEFWAPVARRIHAEAGAGPARRYRIVLETFADLFGPDVIPVDSSKYIPALGRLLADVDADVRVLLLLKDVRNFMVSVLQAAVRNRTPERDRRRMSPSGAFRYWYRHNRAMQRFVAAQGMPVFQLGYEELCLATEPIAQGICRFLDVPFDSAMLDPRSSRSHALRGNRMRHQPEKAVVRYDLRWFTRRDWLLPMVLCPRIMRYNLEQVYSNTTAELWSR